MLQITNASSVPGDAAFLVPDTLKHRNLLVMSTVLLAEDDDNLRYLMEWTLRAMGFAVLACANAQLASTAFRSHGHIDVLLTDVEMPGRSGFELARELTSLCPALPVMIITGSILSAERLKEMAQREWIYISKPCNLLSLQSALDRILSAKLSAV